MEASDDLRRVFGTVLSDAGFEVVLASSNSEAMNALEEFAPDLVLTDCFLQGAGPLIVPILKQSRPKLPVIVLSGDAEKVRKLLPDADAVLAKPISLAELTHTVHRLLAAINAQR